MLTLALNYKHVLIFKLTLTEYSNSCKDNKAYVNSAKTEEFKR